MASAAAWSVFTVEFSRCRVAVQWLRPLDVLSSSLPVSTVDVRVQRGMRRYVTERRGWSVGRCRWSVRWRRAGPCTTAMHHVTLVYHVTVMLVCCAAAVVISTSSTLTTTTGAFAACAANAETWRLLCDQLIASQTNCHRPSEQFWVSLRALNSKNAHRRTQNTLLGESNTKHTLMQSSIDRLINWLNILLKFFGPQWVHLYALRAPVLLNIVAVLLNVSLNK